MGRPGGLADITRPRLRAGRAGPRRRFRRSEVIEARRDQHKIEP